MSLTDEVINDGHRRREHGLPLGRHHLVVEGMFGPRIHPGQIDREELVKAVGYKRLAMIE